MPFPLTMPASKPEPAAAGEQGVPDTKIETMTDELGDTWRQEKQVRLTAQRILAEHLHDKRAKGQHSTDPPSSRFWPDIRLDLGGATLIDFNLENGVMADADFGGAAFSGSAMFGEATFTGSAMFGGAAFSGDAGFGEAAFSGNAGFGRATFSGIAMFDRAAFSGDAIFAGAAFSGTAAFDRATFSRDAGFGGAAFNGDAGFRGATFKADTRFNEATFSGGADSLNFEQSRVLSPDAKHSWPTEWRLEPDGSGGYTVTRANNDGHS